MAAQLQRAIRDSDRESEGGGAMSNVSRLHRRQQRLREAGLCIWCGKNPAKSLCSACRPNKGGRPKDRLRAEIQQKYGLTYRQAQKLNFAFRYQLERCVDDDARRVLLGVKLERKEEASA